MVREVTLTSSVDTIVVRGRTAQLSATPIDAQGRPIAGRQVRWQADAPTIATIDAAGTLTATSSGRVTITAEVDGVRGQLALLVVIMDLENVQQI
ncbi:MAG: Ig-like domain-containing protein, partial [Gemmatimonadetes bacterium]|nr:Ig-like domain-containing protein [Gemmatimonadota bacterium]